MASVNIVDVFNGLTVPKETYIPQENGRFEKQLKRGIVEKGTLCLITGSSKTGKTSLYGKVLKAIGKEPLLVRCSDSLKADEFWAHPLENLDFSRLKAVEEGSTVTASGSATLSGAIGWEWLAKLTGSATVGAAKARTDKEIKESILSKPSPSHLIPLLKNSNAVLVVEDFHYLTAAVQREIFQQWKIFTDNEVSVLVVGTTHHGVDLATANPDLIGRISHIDIGRWSDDDLQRIAKKGLSKLNVLQADTVSRTLAKESAGLPILVQQACAQMFYDREIDEHDTAQPITFSQHEVQTALHNVAITRYNHFEAWYNKLVFGPRRRARRYDTYEIILALFTQDPPTFSLPRHEIDRRLKSAPIPSEKIPPAPSIKSTLAALDNFQKTHNFELLEWSKSDNTVYIVVPSFLFYLRWREPKPTSLAGGVFDLIMNIWKMHTQLNSGKSGLSVNVKA